METSNQGSVSLETSFLTVNRVEQLSFNENSNQDSVATDQYQEIENEVKGRFVFFCLQIDIIEKL